VRRATKHPGLHDVHGRELPGRIIDVAGCETYVAEGGSGPPVFLIHGWGDTADCWRRAVPPLARGHRVLAVDVPPFGRSGQPPLTTGQGLIDFYQGFFPDLFRALGVREAAVVGHSLGGAIALHIALDHPELAARLALVAPAGLGNAPPRWWHAVAGTYVPWPALLGIPTPFSRLAVRAGVRSFLGQRLFYDPRRLRDAVDHLVDLHGGRRELAALLANGRALMEGYTGKLLDRVRRELDRPVLIVWGAADGLVPASHAEAFAAAVPRAEVHVLEHCGHYPQIERPTLFNRLLAGFLAEPLPHAASPAGGQDAASAGAPLLPLR
jgi:pimeloyl-ACP methyl ester carboxylesterase